MDNTMVPVSSLINMIISLIVMVGAPIVAGIVLARGRKPKWYTYLAGVLSFGVMQLVIRIPLLGELQKLPAVQLIIQNNLWIYLVFLAITAALFEGVGRLLSALIIIGPKRDTAGNALAHGVGHGGFECLILVALQYVIYIMVSIFNNSGNLEVFSTLLPPAQLTAIVNNVIGTPSWQFLIGGLERVLTIVLHIGLSVLAFDAIKSRSIKSALLMFALHAAVDFISPGIGNIASISPAVRMILGEFVVLLFAAVSSYLAVRTIKKWKAQEEIDGAQLQSHSETATL